MYLFYRLIYRNLQVNYLYFYFTGKLTPLDFTISQIVINEFCKFYKLTNLMIFGKYYLPILSDFG